MTLMFLKVILNGQRFTDLPCQLGNSAIGKFWVQRRRFWPSGARLSPRHVTNGTRSCVSTYCACSVKEKSSTQEDMRNFFPLWSISLHDMIKNKHINISFTNFDFPNLDFFYPDFFFVMCTNLITQSFQWLKHSCSVETLWDTNAMNMSTLSNVPSV